jgi:hypothetical protein
MMSYSEITISIKDFPYWDIIRVLIFLFMAMLKPYLMNGLWGLTVNIYQIQEA